MSGNVPPTEKNMRFVGPLLLVTIRRSSLSINGFTCDRARTDCSA
jgi:hypothetical protein